MHETCDERVNDMDELEREIERLANKHKGNYINQVDVFKNLVNNLQEQFTVLRQDIRYLRHESEGNTGIIINLINLVNARSLAYNDTSSNDTRNYNNNISKYNAATSKYNKSGILNDIGIQCTRQDLTNDAFNNVTVNSSIMDTVNSSDESSLIINPLDEQIKECRVKQHENVMTHQLNNTHFRRNNNIVNADKLYESITSSDSSELYNEFEDIGNINCEYVHKWKQGTVCVTGDSIM